MELASSRPDEFRLQSEEYEKILFILSALEQRTQASALFMISRNGQEIAHLGEKNDLDLQALSSLAASNLAATFGLAKLLGEREFERIYHKGEKNNILISPVGEKAFLLFLMEGGDEDNLDPRGLKQATLILEDILKKTVRRVPALEE